jgi:hypothetical protein
MKRKITLNVNADILFQARIHAKTLGLSLSELVVNYLNNLILEDQRTKIAPNYKSLIGIIELPDNYDEKMEYSEHLLNKYGR